MSKIRRLVKRVRHAAKVRTSDRNILRQILGARTGVHVTRYTMYGRLSRFRCVDPEGKSVLAISGSQSLCRVLGFDDAQILNADYPKYDLLDLPFPANSFDYVVSDQVLEHIEGNPQTAMEEAFRVLKPGGIGIHTTCFINPIHENPEDYWRFTPKALALLAGKHASIAEADGWGNPFVWPYVWMGLRFVPIPHSSWHPFHWLATKNVENWPIVTWVVARKREN